MREQISRVNMLEPQIQVLMNLIDLQQGGPFNIQRLFHKLTMDASTHFLFGESISSLEFDLPNTSLDLEEFQKRIIFVHSLLFVQEYQFFRVLFFDYGWI